MRISEAKSLNDAAQDFFPASRRVSLVIGDIETPDGAIKEIKRQQDLQWLDAGKYYNLPRDVAAIGTVFICYGAKGDLAFEIPTGELPRLLGWTDEYMAACAALRKMNPRHQNKTSISVRKLFASLPPAQQRACTRYPIRPSRGFEQSDTISALNCLKITAVPQNSGC